MTWLFKWPQKVQCSREKKYFHTNWCLFPRVLSMRKLKISTQASKSSCLPSTSLETPTCWKVPTNCLRRRPTHYCRWAEHFCLKNILSLKGINNKGDQNFPNDSTAVLVRRWGQLDWASLTWTRGPPCLFSACFLLASLLVCFSSKGSFSVSLVILLPLVSGTYTLAFLRRGGQNCTENSNHRHTMALQSSILMFVLLLLLSFQLFKLYLPFWPLLGRYFSHNCPL